MKLFLLLAALIPGFAHADSLVEVNAKQFLLNQASPGAMAKARLGDILMKRSERSIKCVYDFAKKGGAIGAIVLVDEQGMACKIPNKAIVRDVLIDVITAPTSGGSATIAIGSGTMSASNFKAATAIASYTGLVAGIPIGSAATAVKMTSDQSPKITIATAALTAGKLNVHIKYQLSE